METSRVHRSVGQSEEINELPTPFPVISSIIAELQKLVLSVEDSSSPYSIVSELGLQWLLQVNLALQFSFIKNS